MRVAKCGRRANRRRQGDTMTELAGVGKDPKPLVPATQGSRQANPVLGPKVARLIFIYVAAGLTLACALIPIAWMVKTSFESREFIRSEQIQFWPIQFTWDNYLS